MINIKKLKKNDSIYCLKLIDVDKDNFSDFKKIGWSKEQIKSQFNKNTNYSLGIFDNNLLISFIIGDLICIEKTTEYEILIIYVKKSNRRQGLATNLLNYLEKQKQHLNLQKIYLEVSKNNNIAIFFYEKNNFNLINIRSNYYSGYNRKFDALCYVKLL